MNKPSNSRLAHGRVKMRQWLVDFILAKIKSFNIFPKINEIFSYIITISMDEFKSNTATALRTAS